MKAIPRRLLRFLVALTALQSALVTAAFAKPLSISGVTATKIASDRAVITWTTSVPATSQVEYGLATSYGTSSTLDNTLVTSHAVLVTSLAPNTPYHYRVKSQPSPGGGFVVSTDNTFKTLPPPPISYRIQFWDFPNQIGGWPVDMNNRGQVVGWCDAPDGSIHGFLYDPDFDANTAIDLDAVYRATDPAFNGWMIGSATGVNDLGVIVGKIADPQGTIRTFFLDPLGISLNPGIKVLPQEFFPENAVIRYLQINNNLDVLTLYQNASGSYGAYFYNFGAATEDAVPGTLQFLPKAIKTLSFSSPRLNNPTATHAAQVCGNHADGTSFRWTSGLGGGLESFSGLTVRGINDVGEICGDLQKSGKTYPMRLTGSTSQVLSGAPSHYGTAINNSRDVLLDDAVGNTNLILYRDDLGYLELDKLVTGTPADLAIWFGGDRLFDHLNDRDGATGFGEIVGRVDYPNANAIPYILIPEVSTP